MSSWSKRRQFTYSSIIMFLLLIAIGIPAFKTFYKAPTCFDGMKNGNEQGTDCGGSCQRLCASAFLPASTAWTRFEQVAPGYYNVAAYIINPNINGSAKNVPYHIALYDSEGGLIVDTHGTVTIPPHRNTLAYQGAVSTGKRIPTKAFFEFEAGPDWREKSDPLTAITIKDKNYTEEGSNSSLLVTLGNTSVKVIPKMTIYAVLYDNDANAIGFSKTVVDGIGPQSNAIAPFTWPINRHQSVISKEVLPVVE